MKSYPSLCRTGNSGVEYSALPYTFLDCKHRQLIQSTMVSCRMVWMFVVLVIIVAMCVFPAVYTPPPGNIWPNAFEIIGILVIVLIWLFLFTRLLDCLIEDQCPSVSTVREWCTKLADLRTRSSLPNYAELINKEREGSQPDDSRQNQGEKVHHNPRWYDLALGASSSRTVGVHLDEVSNIVLSGGRFTRVQSSNQCAGNLNNPISSKKPCQSIEETDNSTELEKVNSNCDYEINTGSILSTGGVESSDGLSTKLTTRDFIGECAGC